MIEWNYSAKWNRKSINWKVCKQGRFRVHEQTTEPHFLTRWRRNHMLDRYFNRWRKVLRRETLKVVLMNLRFLRTLLDKGSPPPADSCFILQSIIFVMDVTANLWFLAAFFTPVECSYENRLLAVKRLVEGLDSNVVISLGSPCSI